MTMELFESDEHEDAAVLADERRNVPRFYARAIATIYRDNDAMRKGIPCKLHDVSIAGLGLNVEEVDLGLMEPVKVRLQNDVQRFDKEVRGIVRHISVLYDGMYRVGIELGSRLTPLEVSLLKVRPMTGENDGGSTWV
jgi:PilZ domain